MVHEPDIGKNRPKLMTTSENEIVSIPKKYFVIKVQKTCYSQMHVEAENEEQARERAESLKLHMQLIWT